MPQRKLADTLTGLRVEVLPPAKMVTVGEGVIVVSFGIAWQFYISRSEKQADGAWQDVESKTVTPAQLSDYFDSRETLHHPDPLPAHVDVTVPGAAR